MALINRISRLFKADVNAVLDRIEEPEALLKQSIRDMEDALVATERRIALLEHDQCALTRRCRGLGSTVKTISQQLDLCFDSGKDDLARSQIRKRLHAERLLKQLEEKRKTVSDQLETEQAALNDNQATLESLRQKAELFTGGNPAHRSGSAETDDGSWASREMAVGDDEVEIEFLREQAARQAS